MAILYGVSFALHASLGAGMAEIEPEKEVERISIAMVEPPKPKAKDEPPPPPPPPPPPTESKRKAVRPKVPDAAPPPPAPTPAAAAADAPTFGIAMSGGVGMGGVAVPLGDSLHAPKEPVKRAARSKTLSAPKEEASAAPVVEIKPKLLSAPLPAYPEAARAAGIEGKVRLQLTISERGEVVDVKVLESLGSGCDEAAVAVARTYEFEPATRDGKPVATTITIGIRFTL